MNRLELLTVEGRRDLHELFGENFENPRALWMHLVQAGIEIAVWGTSARLLDCPARDREVLLREARWAEALGVPHLRILDGGHSGSLRDDATMRQVVDFLEWWEEERRWHDWEVDLLVEARGALADAAAVGDLRRAWKGNLAIAVGPEQLASVSADDWSGFANMVNHIEVDSGKWELTREWRARVSRFFVPGQETRPQVSLSLTGSIEAIRDAAGILCGTQVRGARTLGRRAVGRVHARASKPPRGLPVQ